MVLRIIAMSRFSTKQQRTERSTIMSTARILQSDQIYNHELKKFVEKTVEMLKLSVVQGFNRTMNPQLYRFKPKELTVGGRVPVNYPSVALVASERLKSLDPQKVNAVRLALGREDSITTAIRARGIDMRSEKSVAEQVDLKQIFDFVNESTFSEAAMEGMVSDLSALAERETIPIREAALSDLRALDITYGPLFPTGWIDDLVGRISAGGGGAALNKGLRFRVHEVKCIDETNPEWPGSDEISWGGAAVDDKGTASKIPEKQVGSGFDDGDRKTYSPPEIIKTFALDSVYPKEFAVTMALAEKDSGGMSDFIQKLYEAIKAEVAVILAALGAAAGAAIGSAIGGSVGTAIGGPLGTIIGVAAGAILGALIGWLVSVLQDDIFAPQASSLFLYSASDTFPGGRLVSPRMEFHYRDHGGHYRIVYDWAITR
jgi:hypothetical protein